MMPSKDMICNNIYTACALLFYLQKYFFTFFTFLHHFIYYIYIYTTNSYLNLPTLLQILSVKSIF